MKSPPVFARLTSGAITLLLATVPVAAQSPQPPPPPPPAGTPDQPKSPDSRNGESLSDTLGRTDGVLRPPPTPDSEIRVPAPVPDPGTTPVIPPPGSLANPSPVRPK